MPTPNETIMKESFFKKFLSVVIIGPLLETLISQKWLYQLMSSIVWFRKNKILIVIIGGVIFGLLHSYSLSYIVFNCFTGTLFMLTYIIRIGNKPYFTVAVLHSLINLFGIIIDPIETMIFK